MPELPEVETLRRDLEKEVVRRKVRSVEVRNDQVVRRHPSAEDFARRLTGRKITGADRQGVSLLLSLDSEEALVVRLGASGRLLKERTAAALERGTDLVITFTTGGDLRCIGLGEDGEAFVAGAESLAEDPELAPPAFDPLAGGFTWQAFSAQLLARRAPLRRLLRDGSFIAGIGPIYSDEILWASGLRYNRRSDTLSAQEVRRLYRAIQEVLQEAIQLRGASAGEPMWVDLYGSKGEFQAQLNAYQREGQPCRRCRTPLARAAAGDEPTWFCPRCQS